MNWYKCLHPVSSLKVTLAFIRMHVYILRWDKKEYIICRDSLKLCNILCLVKSLMCFFVYADEADINPLLGI